MLKILIHHLPPTASGRSVAGSKCCVNSAVSYLLEQVPVCFFSHKKKHNIVSHAETFSDAFLCFISVGWYQRDLLAQGIHERVPEVSSAAVGFHRFSRTWSPVRNCGKE